MWHDKKVLKLFGLSHPILQAPMAGASNAELVAAVSEAGGLGGLGAAAMSKDDLRSSLREIRARTKRPFNVNLFNRKSEDYDQDARLGPKQTALLEQYHSELGLGLLPEPMALFGPADEQLEILLEERVPVISFHFGVDASTVERIKATGARVICSATTTSEAKALEAAGVDAVIAQGAEAGGHRGTFDEDRPEALIGTLALVPSVVDAVSVPVIAAGGIMDARGTVACLALGASGVQLGTIFLGCEEAPVSATWRDALDHAEAEATVVTKVISGRSARGLRNRFVEELEGVDEATLPYPAQYSVGRELRSEAARRNDPNFAAFWAGQGVGLFRRERAADLIEDIAAKAEQVVRRLSGTRP